MRTVVCAIGALVVLIGIASSVHANVPPPPPPPTPPMVILIDDKAKEPRLEIPRQFAPRGGRFGALDRDDDTRFAGGLHLIVAGAALSLAVVAGGLWLVRWRGKVRGTGLALLVATGVLLTVGSAPLWADIPKPPNPKPVIPEGLPFLDKVTVVYVDKVDAIRLVVSKDALEGVIEKASKKETPKKDK